MLHACQQEEKGVLVQASENWMERLPEDQGQPRVPGWGRQLSQLPGQQVLWQRPVLGLPALEQEP